MQRWFLLGGLIAAVIALYSGVWFYDASAVRQRIRIVVDHLNAYDRSLDRPLPRVSYKSVDITGFPFALHVRMNKPVIDFPISRMGFVRQHRLHTPEWDERLAPEAFMINDQVLLKSDRVTVNFAGPVFEQGYMNRRLLGQSVVEHPDVVCNMEIPHEFLDQFDASNQNTKNYVANTPTTYASIACNAKNFRVENPQSHAVLYQAQATSFSYNSKPASNDDHLFYAALKQVNGEFSRAGGIAYNQFVQRLLQRYFVGKNNPYVVLPNPAEYGKITQNFDMSYEGPTTLAAFQSPFLNLRFDIYHSDVHCKLYDSTLSFHAQTGGFGSEDSDSLILHQRLNASAQYDQMMRKAATTPLLRALIPRYHPLGNIQIDIDAGGNVIDHIKNPSHNSSLTLKKFHVSTNPYSVDMTGKYWHQDDQQYTDFDINVRNLDQVMASTQSYETGIIKVLPSTKTQLFAKLGQAYLGRVRRLAQAIATRNGDVSSFEIHQDPGEELTINGKTFIELLPLLR